MAAKPDLRIVLCSPRGFCAGVVRAIDTVERALTIYGAPVYVRHEIVHNKYVVDGLKKKGAIFVEELSEIPDNTNAPVVFSAHGVPKSVPAEARSRNFFSLDATCPLVTKVHREAAIHFKRGREILLIGAHYDSVIGSPGANDNASGVAALLEISRMFASIEPAMTVRFVAFVNEEPPFFMSRQQGSMVYAKSARRRGDNIRLMVSLETIGWYSNRPASQHYPPFFNLFYPDRANFIGMVCDFRSRVTMQRLAQAFRAHSDFPLQTAATFRFVPGVSWSDHRSFWRQGYRALMITDTAPYRYPHYHAATDTPDKLVYPEFSRATLGLCAAFMDIARIGLD